MDQPPSPCDGTCRIDSQTQLCLGCKRSLREIADWPVLSAAQKRAVLGRLHQR